MIGNQVRTLKIKVASIFLITLAGRFFSFFFERLLATMFGSTWTTDSFLIARYLPLRVGLTTNWILGTAFVPAYVRELGKDSRGAAALFRKTAFTLVIIFTAVTILLFLFRDFCIEQLAPGFPKETEAQAVTWFTLLLLMGPMIGFCGLLQAVNSCHNKEFSSSLGQPLSNIVAFLAAVLLVGRYGIKALAYGLLIGAAARLIQQWVTAGTGRAAGGYGKDGEIDQAFRGFLKLSLGLAGLSVLRASIFWLTRRLASPWPGEIASFDFAQTILQLPLSLFEALIFYLIFPRMASHIVESGEEDLWRTTVIGLRFTLLLTIPASLFTMFLREPIVSVLFKAGLFSASAVENTSQWVLFMGLSILPMGIDTLMLRCYVMRGKLSVYGLLFLIRIGLHYALSHALMDRLGPAYGLGSALTIAAIIHAVLLLIVLRMECPIRIGHLGLSDLLRIGSCGITSSLAGYAFHFFLGILTQPSHWIGSAFLLALAGVVSGAVFVLTLRFLGPLEFDRLSEVLSSVRSRQTRRPQSDT